MILHRTFNFFKLSNTLPRYSIYFLIHFVFFIILIAHFIFTLSNYVRQSSKYYWFEEMRLVLIVSKHALCFFQTDLVLRRSISLKISSMYLVNNLASSLIVWSNLLKPAICQQRSWRVPHCQPIYLLVIIIVWEHDVTTTQRNKRSKGFFTNWRFRILSRKCFISKLCTHFQYEI